MRAISVGSVAAPYSGQTTLAADVVRSKRGGKMGLTIEQHEAQIKERMERWADTAFKCFSGPEYEYQAAIQNYDYMAAREGFVDDCLRLCPKEKAKMLIRKDYQMWRMQDAQI